VHVSEDVITEAFALSRARGAALLARLGDFNVWQGDLAAMRRDSPPADPGRAPSKREPVAPLSETLLMARAIELLQPDCRTVLSRLYGGADDAGGKPSNDTAANCRNRLLEIYMSLQSRSGELTTPEWVAEREHAALAHGRHRR
jgi:hypothetical protein